MQLLKDVYQQRRDLILSSKGGSEVVKAIDWLTDFRKTWVALFLLLFLCFVSLSLCRCE